MKTRGGISISTARGTAGSALAKTAGLKRVPTPGLSSFFGASVIAFGLFEIEHLVVRSRVYFCRLPVRLHGFEIPPAVTKSV